MNKITGQRWSGLLGTTRKARIISASAIFLAACAFGAAGVAPLAPNPDDLPVVAIAEELPLPDLVSQISSLEQTDQSFIQVERVRRGDTLAALFNRLGIDDPAAQAFVKSNKVAHAVIALKPGARVQAQVAANGELQWLRTSVADGREVPVTVIEIARRDGKFSATAQPAQLERRVEMRSRQITSSLYAATDSSPDGSPLPDAITAQIIDMFSTNIDFRSDLQRGDRFSVVYESFWFDGEMVRAGRILAGEFINRGVNYRSVWFDGTGGKGGGYYSLDGKALKRAFLKSPLAFSRISSGFSMRVHPLSGKWKQHKGIDFAASTGTPIRAAGDGVIESASRSPSYGNLVVIKHWNNYSTAYAHMSRFAPGIRRGAKVSQGDLIGYVGSTGWSSGPHLHYEFRVAGRQVDPRRISITAQAPLTPAELSRFRVVSAEMMHRFGLLKPAGDTALAMR